MAFCEPMRADPGLEPGLSERKLFGGLYFLLHGFMCSGAMKAGAMYRRMDVTPAPGAQPLALTGCKMGGLAGPDDGLFADDATRAALTELSLAHAASLPPKG
jgi:hypothetical protein